MINSILEMLNGEVGSQIIEKANIPPEQLGGVLEVIGSAAQEGVASQLASGDLSTVMNLFSNNSNSGEANQLQSSIQGNIISGLISKLGLSDSVAQMISTIAVPALLGLITKKNSETPDDDPSPLQDVFGDVISGKGGGIGGMLGGLFN